MYILNWRPPYDWQWMLNFFGERAVDGIETVTSVWYERSLTCNGHQGLIRATPDLQNCTLQVILSDGLKPVAESCLALITRQFDLNCDPGLISATLGNLCATRPGLRLPGSMDAYEQAVRAIMSQLVSVSMAARLMSKVVTMYGDPLDTAPSYRSFPYPARLAAAGPQEMTVLGIPFRRASALINLSRLVVTNEFPITMPVDVKDGIKTLQQFPGIGRWTANYFAMRGWQARDIFLPDDYLIKQRFAGMTSAQIRRYAERWQPWRSYAMLYIWYTEGWTPT